MTEALKNILERRSIRQFKAEQISDDKLHAILEAGTLAPTASNNQGPLIVVIQDAEMIRRLSKMNASFTQKPESDPFYSAPTVAIVLSNPDINPNYIQDGSLVMGNLMNAAHAVGVGSCWINRAKEVFGTDEGKELLSAWGVPDGYVGIGNCILGYVDGDYPEPKPRKEGYVIRP